MSPTRTKTRTRAETSTEKPKRPNSIRLGRIVGVFGIHGELKLDPSRSGADSIAAGMAIEGQVAGARQALRVQSVRTHHRQLLVLFDEFDATNARTLVGADLYASRDDIALEDGEYLDEDLVGCILVGADGGTLGEVVDVLHYPAQDMLVIGAQRKFVPLVSAFVRGVDLARRCIEVDLPEGLLED